MSEKMNKEQFSRLPKYAQREIERLQTSVQFWKGRSIGFPESSVWWEPSLAQWTESELKMFLPEHATAYFDIGTAEISVSIERDEKFLIVSHFKGGRLTIEPRAANVVWVR